MFTTRIAAGAAVLVLGVSGIALAAGSDDRTAGVETAAETSTTVATSVVPIPGTAVGDTGAGTSVPDSVPTTGVAASATTVPHTTSTTMRGPTSTTADDRTTSTMGGATTSTTVGDRDDSDHWDDSDGREARTVAGLGVQTHVAGEAGTVIVDGMTVVGVTTNPGWTVEIDEVSADRIEIEFENGDAKAEFELRSDGELRIRG